MPQYQGIWSLPEQTQALTNQQWVTDPNFKNTVLLLQADGTGSGSQNHDFRDSSSNNFYISRFGNASQGSFSPFCRPDGEWSNYFNGSSLIRTVANPNLAFGTGAITFECWFNTISTNNMGMWGSTNEAAWTSNSYAFNYYNGAIILWNNTNLWSIAVGTLHDGIWHHIAIVRNGTTWQVFVDGISKGTTTTEGTRDLGNNSWRVGIGSTEPSGGATEKFVGYLSNVRVSNIALYTGNFIPSALPLSNNGQGVSSTNVKFLSCQSNQFVDNSTNATTFTAYGAPYVRAFSPFSSRQWTPEVVGGSGYFDGSGDSLSLGSTTLNLSSNDFTIETWIYATTTDRDCIIGSIADANGLTAWMVMLNNESSQVRFYARYSSGSTLNYNAGSGNFPINSWNHVAVTRNGANLRIFLNGVQIGTTNTTLSTNSIDNASTDYYLGRTTDNTANFTGYLSGTRVIVGTALYTTTFTPPTTPPTAITNTKLLLNYANAGIYDSTGQTNWETKALKDGTRVDTLIKKNGSGSFYIDGTQAYAGTERILPSENYPSLIFGTGDFTIETWLYCIGKPTNSGISGIWDQRPGVNGTYVNFVVDFGGYGGAAATPTLVLYADSATRLRSDVIPLQRWFHAVLCRSNGYTRMYIDGKLACTPLADSRDYGGGGSAGNYRPVIGQTDGGDAFYGFMDDFRASRFCRYNIDFIPPKQALPRQ